MHWYAVTRARVFASILRSNFYLKKIFFGLIFSKRNRAITVLRDCFVITSFSHSAKQMMRHCRLHCVCILNNIVIVISLNYQNSHGFNRNFYLIATVLLYRSNALDRDEQLTRTETDGRDVTPARKRPRKNGGGGQKRHRRV